MEPDPHKDQDLKGVTNKGEHSQRATDSYVISHRFIYFKKSKQTNKKTNKSATKGKELRSPHSYAHNKKKDKQIENQ